MTHNLNPFSICLLTVGEEVLLVPLDEDPVSVCVQQLDDAVVVLDGGGQDDLLRLALHLEQLLVHLGQP